MSGQPRSNASGRCDAPGLNVVVVVFIFVVVVVEDGEKSYDPLRQWRIFTLVTDFLLSFLLMYSMHYIYIYVYIYIYGNRIPGARRPRFPVLGGRGSVFLLSVSDGKPIWLCTGGRAGGRPARQTDGRPGGRAAGRPRVSKTREVPKYPRPIFVPRDAWLESDPLKKKWILPYRSLYIYLYIYICAI